MPNNGLFLLCLDTVGIVRVRVPAPRTSSAATIPHDQSVQLDQCAQPDGRRGADHVPGAAAHGHHQPAGQRAAGRRLPRRASCARSGYEPELLESAPGRTNLVCRRRGTGAAPPLLLTAHLDVVEAAAESGGTRRSRARCRGLPVGARRDRHEEHGRDVHGDHAPAGARERRAVARRHLRRGGRRGGRLRPGLALAGREAPRAGRGGVRDRRVGRLLAAPRQDDLLSGAGRREGHLLGARARARRARPRLDAAPRQRGAGAVGAAGPACAQVRFPAHENATCATSSTQVARGSRALVRPLVRLLEPSAPAAAVLRRVPDAARCAGFSALLSNTASPTVVRAGNKINVIPDRAEVEIDGRTLPGQTDEDFLRELRRDPRPGRRARGHQVGAAGGDRAGRVAAVRRSSAPRSSSASRTRWSCRT